MHLAIWQLWSTLAIPNDDDDYGKKAAFTETMNNEDKQWGTLFKTPTLQHRKKRQHVRSVFVGFLVLHINGNGRLSVRTLIWRTNISRVWERNKMSAGPNSCGHMPHVRHMLSQGDSNQKEASCLNTTVFRR